MASIRVDSGQVHIIEHDAGVRRATVALLQAGGLIATGFESPQRYLDEVSDTDPTCIVTAVRTPMMSGMQLIDRLHQRGVEHPVIVVTGFGDTETAVRAFRLGAFDFFEKPVAGSLLLDAVQRALEHDRRRLARTSRAVAVQRKLDRLSRREVQVMEQLIGGSSNKQIAWQLKLSEKTVAAHRANMLAKMQVDSLAELIVMVISTGAYKLDPVAPADPAGVGSSQGSASPAMPLRRAAVA